MARRLFGIGLIAFAFLLLWANSQPEPKVGGRKKHSQTWMMKTVHFIQTSRPFAPKPLPLCTRIQDLADGDDTLDSYRPQVLKVTLLSQIQDGEIKAMLEKCLAEAFPTNPKLSSGFEMEVDVFDTSNAASERDSNTRAWKTAKSVDAELSQNLVLQFSFLDSNTANKVAEAAMTIDYDIIEKSRGISLGQKKTR